MTRRKTAFSLHCTDDPNVDPSTCEAIKSAGIQVFPGFQQKVDESRTNIAAYTDLEWSFGDKFMLGTAGRFERYSYFGSTVSGKLSSRYDFTPAFALRGSVNTGFRGPITPSGVLQQSEHTVFARSEWRTRAL